MTLVQAISDARSWARVTESSEDDAAVMEAINRGQKQFAVDCHGLTKEAWPALTPLFDTRTHFAIRVTIVGGTNEMDATDVALTTTDRDNVTGTQVATDLQATLRTAIGVDTITVAWSTTAWTFTIDTIDATSLTIEAPEGITYADATDLLFGGTSLTDNEDYTHTGNMPTDCTVEVAMPSDYDNLAGPVEWNGQPLRSASWDIFASPQGFSNRPTHYGIRNDRMRFSPSPNQQGMLHFWYEYVPTDFSRGYQEVGLSGKFLSSATGLSNSTTYYFKVGLDGATAVEFSITTVSATTYDDVIDLINAAAVGFEVELVSGDLRFTSLTMGTGSAVALAAGTTGTSLFATLTGYSALNTAVAGAGGTEITLAGNYADAPIYYAAMVLAEHSQDYKIADRMYAQFRRLVTAYNVKKANDNPKMPQHLDLEPMYRVVIE